MGGSSTVGWRQGPLEEIQDASTKKLASRLYQMKTGPCLAGQYPQWTKNRPTAQCWWCRHRTQTRDHFKECPEWKPQQKILWEEVLKEMGRWKVRDLLAGGRCNRAVLDFLASTDVGRLVPDDGDTGSEVSEWELRERLEREEERSKEAEELGAAGDFRAGEEWPLFLPTPSFMASADEEWGTGGAFLCFSFVFHARSATLPL